MGALRTVWWRQERDGIKREKQEAEAEREKQRQQVEQYMQAAMEAEHEAISVQKQYQSFADAKTAAEEKSKEAEAALQREQKKSQLVAQVHAVTARGAGMGQHWTQCCPIVLPALPTCSTACLTCYPHPATMLCCMAHTTA